MNIVYKAKLETEIKFNNIDFKEAVRYIALNWTEMECRTSNIWRLLPRRSKKQGVRPGMTGEGPLGPDEGKKDQWKFPNLGRLTELEKKMILAHVMRIAVLTMFRTHVYSFENRYFLQQIGGPIGLRGTCAVARLTMVEWDRKWMDMMTKLGISVEDAARYMDDLRVYLHSIKKGWRWKEDELCWCEEWEEEDKLAGKSDLARTCELLQESMNKIFQFLNFTVESEEDFTDRRLPTLDFKIWVDKNNIIHYTFFEKPTSSNQMIHLESALPENTKMATLNSEVVRRMQNVSELLPMSERVEVLDKLSQKLSNSGYKLDKVRKILVGGLSGYEKRLRQSKMEENKGYRPLHESAAGSQVAGSRKKLTGKNTS